MTYDAGRAKHKIEIKRFTLTRNAVGESVKTPVTQAWKRAVISQDEGQEAWATRADQFVNTTVTKFEIRYDSRITTEMWIEWQNRIFRIVSVIDPGERRFQTTIKAQEVQEAIA